MKAFFHPGGWPVRILLCVGLAVLLVVGGLRPATPYPKLLTDTLGEEALPYLQRLGLSTQDAGLRVEALAYACDGGQARLYITVQDLTGNILNGEWPNIQMQSDMRIYPNEQMGFHNATMIGYDAQSRTALLELHNWKTNGPHFVEPQPPTSGHLSIAAFLSEKAAADIDIGITLAEIQALNATHRPNPDPEGTALEFDEYVRELPEIGWARISNIGMVGDRVHILTEPTTPSGVFGMLSFKLVDKDGNDLEGYSSGMGSSKELAMLLNIPGLGSEKRDYFEYNLSIPEGTDPETTRLVVYADGYSQAIMGAGWKFGFPMRQTASMKQGDHKDTVQGPDGRLWMVDRVQASPLCAEIYGTTLGVEAENPELPSTQLVLSDGSVRTADNHPTSLENRLFACRGRFDMPCNIEDVVAVRFGDVDFPVA